MQKLGSNLLHIMTVIQHYFIAIVGCSSVGSSPFLSDNSGSKRNSSLEIIIESEDCNLYIRNQELSPPKVGGFGTVYCVSEVT